MRKLIITSAIVVAAGIGLAACGSSGGGSSGGGSNGDTTASPKDIACADWAEAKMENTTAAGNADTQNAVDALGSSVSAAGSNGPLWSALAKVYQSANINSPASVQMYSAQVNAICDGTATQAPSANPNSGAYQAGQAAGLVAGNRMGLYGNTSGNCGQAVPDVNVSNNGVPVAYIGDTDYATGWMAGCLAAVPTGNPS